MRHCPGKRQDGGQRRQPSGPTTYKTLRKELLLLIRGQPPSRRAKTWEGTVRQRQSGGGAHRRRAADGRQPAFLSASRRKPSLANHAWVARRSAPTPDPRLDASLAPRLAARLRHARHGTKARCEAGRHPPPGAGRAPPMWPWAGTERRRQRPAEAAQHKEHVERPEANAYGQQPLAPGARTPQHRTSLWGRPWPAPCMTSKRPMRRAGKLSDQRRARPGHGFSRL